MSDLIRFAPARLMSRASLHAVWLSGGALKAYTEPVPASGGEPISTQTLLADYSLPDPIGDVTDGIITGDTIPAALSLATGTVAFLRAEDSGGNEIGDYDAGPVGSDAAAEMDSLALVEGSLSTITSLVIAEG